MSILIALIANCMHCPDLVLRHLCVCHCRIAPVMGAGYHTLHHTVYNKNYGHYFTYMDKLHDTLFSPEEDEERRLQRHT